MPTLDGHEPVRIPAGTQTGTVFRLKGKGMPSVTGRGRGDLYVQVEVMTPRKLSRAQRTLLEQFAKTLPAEQAGAAPQRRGRRKIAACSSASRTSSASVPTRRHGVAPRWTRFCAGILAGPGWDVERTASDVSRSRRQMVAPGDTAVPRSRRGSPPRCTTWTSPPSRSSRTRGGCSSALRRHATVRPTCSPPTSGTATSPFALLMSPTKTGPSVVRPTWAVSRSGRLSSRRRGTCRRRKRLGKGFFC